MEENKPKESTDIETGYSVLLYVLVVLGILKKD